MGLAGPYTLGDGCYRLVSSLCAVGTFNLQRHVRQRENRMTAAVLFPGDTLCSIMGVPKNSDHRMILRSFFNMLFWGAVGTFAIVAIML